MLNGHVEMPLCDAIYKQTSDGSQLGLVASFSACTHVDFVARASSMQVWVVQTHQPLNATCLFTKAARGHARYSNRISKAHSSNAPAKLAPPKQFLPPGAFRSPSQPRHVQQPLMVALITVQRSSCTIELASRRLRSRSQHNPSDKHSYVASTVADCLFAPAIAGIVKSAPPLRPVTASDSSDPLVGLLLGTLYTNRRNYARR